ncbi:baseplate J/gp47 family protein [Photobacterium swingsii]|uniref:baseplate J/gp47 family protein n=1 Tax=Photobacterium swingsii TaxID=680026 RepID=UPI00352DFBA5
MSTPQAFAIPEFETLYRDYTAFAVKYVSQQDPEKGQLLAKAFANESELLAQSTQAFLIKRIAEIREQNYWALQQFRKFVTESDMVDLLALQYGLKRQVIEPGDDSVFPAKPPKLESNEDLLRRFDLAPYQFHTTGTRAGYKFHALTLDERPRITIEPEPNAVVMRFEFSDIERPVPIKDAVARMLEPNSGKVTVAILSRETPDGTASQALIDRVSNYMNRDDIAQESDEITVKSASPKSYKIEATLFTGAEPGNDISNDEALQAAWDFAEKSHRLEGRIDRLELGHEFYQLGVKRVAIAQPTADVVCDWDEAPHCVEVVINVRAE